MEALFLYKVGVNWLPAKLERTRARCAELSKSHASHKLDLIWLWHSAYVSDGMSHHVGALRRGHVGSPGIISGIFCLMVHVVQAGVLLNGGMYRSMATQTLGWDARRLPHWFCQATLQGLLHWPCPISGVGR